MHCLAVVSPACCANRSGKPHFKARSAQAYRYECRDTPTISNPMHRCLNSVARSPARTVQRHLEHFAQEALGHNSVDVHRAYAKRAKMKLPSLEEYEKKAVSLAASSLE